MKTAVISDIHSNLEALEAVRKVIKRENITRVFCLGDILGYNANPVECLKIVRELNPVCVAGNHDFAAVGLTNTDYFNPYAKVAAIWSGKQLNEEQTRFIKSLQLVHREGEVTLVHASLHDPELWGYILTQADANASFEYQETPLCFIGHSHFPCIYFEEGVPLVCPEGVIQLNKEIKTVVNVGSVGQPRDGNPKASFVIYDPENYTVDFQRVAYDIETTQKKVLDAGLPSFLAERLSMGR